MSRWVEVCRTDDIPHLEGRRVVVEGFHIAVFNTEEGFYALSDLCPHLGGPLSDGEVAAATVACPLHVRKFDLKTGEAKNDDLPKLPAFPVKTEGDAIFLDIERPSSRLRLSRPCAGQDSPEVDENKDDEEVA